MTNKQLEDIERRQRRLNALLIIALVLHLLLPPLVFVIVASLTNTWGF